MTNPRRLIGTGPHADRKTRTCRRARRRRKQHLRVSGRTRMCGGRLSGRGRGTCPARTQRRRGGLCRARMTFGGWLVGTMSCRWTRWWRWSRRSTGRLVSLRRIGDVASTSKGSHSSSNAHLPLAKISTASLLRTSFEPWAVRQSTSPSRSSSAPRLSTRTSKFSLGSLNSTSNPRRTSDRELTPGRSWPGWWVRRGSRSGWWVTRGSRSGSGWVCLGWGGLRESCRM